MTNRLRKTVFTLLLLGLLLVAFTANSHTPYRPEVVFAHEFPDRPVSQFVAGHLGILTPELADSYRVVAYRYFSGKPLSLLEQKSFMAQPNVHPFYALKPYEMDHWEKEWEKELQASPVRRWVRARAQFRKDKPPVSSASKDWWEYTDGENCQGGAFLNAVRTLRARARTFGAESRELQEWISGQDEVFLNCAERHIPTHQVFLPGGLPPSAPPLLRADRAYQIAAAHFYAGDYDEAVTEFDTIAKDTQSPWAEWGSYLAARVSLRSSFPAKFQSFYDEQGNFDRVRLQKAEESFREVERETHNRAIRRSSRGLLSFIAFRLRPEEQTRVVTQRISRGQSATQFGQDVEDFVLMLDKKFGATPDFPEIEPYTKQYSDSVRRWKDKRFQELRAFRATSDLTNWMYTMSFGAGESRCHHAVTQWQSRKTLPWLVAAISMVEGSSSAMPELLQSAEAVPPDSPAYPTLLYHRARLLRERGDATSARQLLDNALTHSQGWPVSSINLLKKQRFLLATDPDDLARFAWRRPLGYSNGAVNNAETDYCDPEGWDVKCEPNLFLNASTKEFLPQLDVVSAVTFNEHLPINLLVQLVHSPNLPPNLRARMAPAVWARALILDRPELAGSISQDAIAARPEMKSYVESYQRATQADMRRFLAAYAIAHFPGLRPYVEGPSPRLTRFDYADNYRDNWWCRKGDLLEFTWFDGDDTAKLEFDSVPDPNFLSPDQHQAAKNEARQLSAVASDNWLSDILINWAKVHPDDPNSPEALHFAWRVMRFACDGTAKRSREVVILLHKLYPDSPWTKKTKVWF